MTNNILKAVLIIEHKYTFTLSKAVQGKETITGKFARAVIDPYGAWAALGIEVSNEVIFVQIEDIDFVSYKKDQ